VEAVGVGAGRRGPRGGGASRNGVRRRAFPAALASLACAAALAGCGGLGAGQGTGSRAELLSTLENWSALETPVDQALGILTQKCMARHGLAYYPFPQAGQPGASPLFATQLFGSALWLGPQSLAWRIVNGWGLYEETMQQLGQPGGFVGGMPQEFRVMQSLRGQSLRSYMTTLWGGGKTMKIRIPGLGGQTIQIGGCNTKAGVQLFGSAAASVAVPQYGPAILNGSIQSSAARSTVLRASEARWSACIRAGTGIAVSSPWQLFLHFHTLYETKGPTLAVHRQELAAAVADFNCQRRSHLPQSVRQASLAAVGHLPDSVLGELQTLVGVLEEARVRARTVFSQSENISVPSITGTAQSAAPQPTGGGGRSGGSVVVFGG
jgi:hypothetical protein